MPAKKIKTKQEEKSTASDYLKKAEDNHAQMLSALDKDNYNAAGTLAVQCAISSADAICVYEKGIRSISQDHFDVCDRVRFSKVNSFPGREREKQYLKKNHCQKESYSI